MHRSSTPVRAQASGISPRAVPFHPDAWPNILRQSHFVSAVDHVQAERLRRMGAEEMARAVSRFDESCRARARRSRLMHLGAGEVHAVTASLDSSLLVTIVLPAGV